MQRLLHLNRGLPWGACLRFKYNTRPEIQGEISPRIKCSSLRFKCNSLLHLNRGLPWGACLRFKCSATVGLEQQGETQARRRRSRIRVAKRPLDFGWRIKALQLRFGRATLESGIGGIARLQCKSGS